MRNQEYGLPARIGQAIKLRQARRVTVFVLQGKTDIYVSTYNPPGVPVLAIVHADGRVEG
jgi:hypothetical protein